MAEITGGELGFEFTLDAENLKKGLTDSEGRLMGFTEVAEKAGTTLQSSFDKSGSRVKDFTGIVRENVSIQKQVIKELESQIKEIQERAAGVAPGIGQATILNEAKGLEKDLAAEKAALADLELAMGKTVTTSTTLGTKLAEAKNRLAELNLAAKEGKEVTAEQFREAEAEVKKYGEAISDTNARTKALTAGTIGGLAQGLSLVTGTMAMGTSLLGAFGGKSEELNQIMLKTQALLAATVTLQEIKNTTVQQGGVISGVMAVQEYARARGADAAAIASGRATIAQRAWNLVANANPYILLATAILTVVGAIGLYIAATSKAAKEAKLQAEINNKLADSVAEPLIEYKKLQAQWNSLGNDLKAKEKFVDDNKKSFQSLGLSVNSVTDAEAALVKNTSAVVQALMLRAKANAKMEIATEAYKTALKARMQHDQDNADLKAGGMRRAGAVLRVNSYMTSQVDQQNSANDTFNRMFNESIADAKEASKVLTYTAETTKNAVRKIKSDGNKSNASKNSIIEEILPLGSVAEIQKRLQAIDDALSKATNADQISKLKEKRIATAKELEEAEKAIMIRSFDEQLDFTKKSIELRDKMMQQGYSKEQVDKIFPEIKDTSLSNYLEETAAKLSELLDSGKGNPETADNLAKINEEIRVMRGLNSAIDDAGGNIEKIKGKFSGVKLIEKLNESRSKMLKGATEQETNAINKLYDDAGKEAVKAQQEKFKQILDEQKNYEEKSAALAKEYADMKNSDEYQNASDSERSKIDKSFSDRQGVLDIEMIKKSAEWEVAFGELEGMTNNSLKLILARLIEFRDKSKGTLSVSDAAELQKAIDRVQSAANKNPFSKLISNYTNYRTSLLESKKAQSDYNDAVEKFGSKSKEASEAGEKMVQADKKAVESKKQLIGQLQEGQNIFNAIGQGIMDLGDAFGGFDDATNDAIGNIMDIGNAAFDLGKSIASGDVAGMISAGIKLIGSIGKALNGDQKKEREIKKQAAALKELEKVYNDLGRAIDKALGEGVFTASQDAITNLKQQKAILEQMMRTEQSKKKADKEKINGYKDQINSINNAIEDMQQSMIDKVLNGLNAKGLADKLSDALTTAFQNGEDAATAMGKTVDDILRDMVKNALKMKILEPAMQAVVDKMLASMGYSVGANGITGTFDDLTEAEREELKNMMNQAGTNYMDALGAYTDLFGSQAGNAQGLKGDIKGITEKTAGALEAQINAMRQYQVEGLNIHRNNQQTFIASLQNLIMIEANTRKLHNIDKTLEEMNGKMAKGLAGI